MAWTYSLTYTPVNDYSVKDGLASGQAEKIILGSDIDDELSGIQTALNSKLDAGSVSSQAEAEAGTDTESVMTPQGVQYWGDANDGIVGDLRGISGLATGGDKLFFFDDTDDTAKALTVGTGLAITGTTIATDDANIAHDSLSGFVANEHIDHSGVSVISASAGLAASNNDLTSNIGLSLDISTLADFGITAGVDLDTDTLAVSDGGTEKEILASQLITPEDFTTVATTTHTLDEGDFGKMIDYSSTSTTTITLPNSLKTGFWCVLRKTGASGDVVLSATTTLQTANSLTTWSTQYAAVTVMHIGSNVWVAWGALES